jgi:hypothetical protein
MPEKEGQFHWKGIFRGSKPEDFQDDGKIKKRLAIEGELPEVKHFSQVKVPRGLDEYQAMARDRAKSAEEFSPRSENQVHVGFLKTIAVALLGDAHIGTKDTDYERLTREVDVITHTPDTKVILVGDMVDGIHWGGAAQGENIMSIDEQHGYLRALWDSLRGRVIVGVSGEHDSKWAQRTGIDPYSEFTERTGAPYVRGVAEVRADVGSQTYNLVVAHNLKGNSIYNDVHPEMRAQREMPGADVYIGAHTHRKGVSQAARREFGGTARETTFISVGPYKRSDEYAQRQGYPEMDDAQMGGVAIRLDGEEKKVETGTNIITALKRWFG